MAYNQSTDEPSTSGGSKRKRSSGEGGYPPRKRPTCYRSSTDESESDSDGSEKTDNVNDENTENVLPTSDVEYVYGSSSDNDNVECTDDEGTSSGQYGSPSSQTEERTEYNYDNFDRWNQREYPDDYLNDINSDLSEESDDSEHSESSDWSDNGAKTLKNKTYELETDDMEDDEEEPVCSLCSNEEPSKSFINCKHSFCIGCIKQHLDENYNFTCVLCENENDSSENDCCVCMQSHPLEKLNCKHQFCILCLNNLSNDENQITCPLCRARTTIEHPDVAAQVTEMKLNKEYCPKCLVCEKSDECSYIEPCGHQGCFECCTYILFLSKKCRCGIDATGGCARRITVGVKK